MPEYAQAVVDGWSDADLLRLHLHELPRSLMGLDRERRIELLAERPPLTGTPWDVLLAAMVEHVCELHDLEPPEWSQERERFVAIPHFFTTVTTTSRPWCTRRRRSFGTAHSQTRATWTHGAERNMSGSLDHALTRQLFDELSAALQARGVRGHVYLVGGGAMITGYGRDRTTKDVDVRIDEAKDEVLAAARAVGERHGLDERWLDLGAAQFVPRGDDVRAKTIHNSPGLLVTGASAEHLLAMKVFAARRADLEDIKHLAGILGITRETLRVTVRDPEAPDHDEQRPVRRVDDAPGPIRTLDGATAAVNAYERRARTRDGMAPMETPVELKPVEVLRAEGERGRRYRAEWIRSGAAADLLDLSVTDPSSANEEQSAYARVLQRTTGDGLVRSIEQANEVINRYEQDAAGQD